MLPECEDEQALPNQSQEFDKILSLDLPRYVFLSPVFWKLTRNRAKTEPLFSFSVATLILHMKATASTLGARHPAFPYQLRHTGASTDFATGDRSLIAI